MGPGDSQFPLRALDPTARMQQLPAAAAGLTLSWDLCRIFPPELLIPSRLGKLRLGKSNGFGMEGRENGSQEGQGWRSLCGGLLRSCWDVKCGRVSKMDNGLSDKKKKKGILIFILSQCPKNNLQQHLKGQASKSPPPSPKTSIPLGLGLEIHQHCSGAGPI